MHHEDRAGVNALIRGVDGPRHERLPVLTIMCTNRVGAVDPAIRRRAAAILTFRRPDDRSREELLRRSLRGTSSSRAYGCTYSDLRQRLVPTAVLTTVGAGVPLTDEGLVALARDFVPTRPFEAELTGQA
jgi:SpoVK/Ycf46/Vps4 family AAA+-type ATPase